MVRVAVAEATRLVGVDGGNEKLAAAQDAKRLVNRASANRVLRSLSKPGLPPTVAVGRCRKERVEMVEVIR